jgi:precorrin-6Y C5,15-methyltransferase (decarboxylating)
VLPLLGIPEEAIAHRQGMITKRELRLLALCYLALHPGDVLWDVGAGSGSVSVEAARLSASLQVFAVERSAPALTHIEHNIRQFALSNVHPVRGEAPEALALLPDPDAVFIGGSGGRLADMISAVVPRLRPGGRLVMHCITLENFALGWELLRQHPLQVDTTAVQLSHTKPLGPWHRLESESPIFIVRATKP